MPDPENRGWPKRFLLFVCGLLLVPAIVGSARAVYDMIPAAFGSEPPFVAREPLAVLIGYAVWTLLFVFCPPSIKMYIWGHELTHAAWGLLTGSRIGKIKVGESGGYVNMTNPGIFTTLAPYFVPFYMLVVLLLRWIAGLFADMTQCSVYWLVLIGMAYGFHVTYTIRSLVERQPDIREFGRVISYSLILLFNVLIFGYGVVGVTDASVSGFHSALADRNHASYRWTFERTKALVLECVDITRDRCAGKRE